jgi:hypothetical protein
MRLLSFALCILLIPGSASARCAPFDLVAAVDKVPFIVHGKVTRSNKEQLLSAPCSPKACKHRFSVDVIELVKGKSEDSTLQFEYDYVPQRPEIILFAEGDEYVFAVGKIAAGGRATLLGTSCGRSGLEVKELEKIKQAAGRR